MNTKISNIQISIKKEVEETRDIAIPAFYKLNGGQYFAVLDEETQIELYVFERIGTVQITHGSLSESAIARVHLTHDLCTEEEFMTAYNKAHESIRLAPVIKTGMLYDQEKVDALQNSIAL